MRDASRTRQSVPEAAVRRSRSATNDPYQQPLGAVALRDLPQHMLDLSRPHPEVPALQVSQQLAQHGVLNLIQEGHHPDCGKPFESGNRIAPDDCGPKCGGSQHAAGRLALRVPQLRKALDSSEPSAVMGIRSHRHANAYTLAPILPPAAPVPERRFCASPPLSPRPNKALFHPPRPIVNPSFICW